MKIMCFDRSEVLEKILSTSSYIDVVKIWFDKKPNFSIGKLRSMSGDNTIERLGPMVHWDRQTGERIEDHTWRYHLCIHQPSVEALRYIAERQIGRMALINYLEFALDFITQDRKDAIFLHDFFDVCWVKRWHGKQIAIKQKNGTSYSGRREAAINNIIYSDRFSKVAGENCCHLEVRLKGTACKAAKLSTFEELMCLDQQEFWKKYLVLRQFKDEAAIKKILERGIRKYGLWKQKRIELKPDRSKTKKNERNTIPELVEIYFNLMLRACSSDISDDRVITAQNVIDLPWFDKMGKKYLKEITNDAFLPKEPISMEPIL